MEHTALWPGWETVRVIGRGSFGTVYEIRRTLFGEVEKAALKVITIPQNASDIEELRSDGFDMESITRTFQNHLKSIVNEYSLMRKMNGCTNIVNCDDVRYVQHEDGIGWDIYIKMELLTPLTKTLPNAIPEETVIKIAMDLCSALELCKKYDIVHRDIKPQNIFVSDNGDYKLGDFGIAKTVEKTMSGTKIGTYKYMAPEVYNNQPYGSAADIYSLGLVLYWLLNERRMPFLPLPPVKLGVGMDEAARTRRLTGEPIPPPKNGSEELKRIVLKACAYEPRERYTDAHQMKEALNHLSGTSEEPEEEGTVSAPKPAAAKKVPVTPPDEEMAESDATIVPPSQENVPEREEKHTPPSAPKKRRGPLIAAVCVIAGLLVGGSVFFLGNSSRRIETAAPSTTEAATEAPTEDETARLDAAYAAAEQLLQAGEYDQAIEAFEALDGYSDSAAQITKARQAAEYAAAEALEQSGKTAEAAIVFYKLGDKERSFALWDKAAVRNTITAGFRHTVGLQVDGTVVAVGQNDSGRCDVDDWSDIVAVSAGYHYTVGLKADGTVVAVGSDSWGMIRVTDWSDIVAVSARHSHTAGLKADGTVVTVGSNTKGECNVNDWSDIIAVSAGESHTVGLKSDGTVLAVGENVFGQCDVSGWSDIVAVSAGGNHTVGLKSDGTVIAVGYNLCGQCDVSDWKDIVAISAGPSRTVGLKADGTVVAVGWNDRGQCNVGGWTDIVAMSTGYFHTIGLKSDGTVVIVGDNEFGQCNVADWKNIKLPPISTEHQAKLDAAKQAFEAQQAADYAAAEKLYQAGNYDQAIAAFEALDGYKDSADQIQKAQAEKKAWEDRMAAKETTAPIPDIIKKVALITDVGTIDDESFNQACWQGVEAWCQANGIEYTYYQPTVDSTDARVLSVFQAVSEGANAIVMPGYLFGTTVLTVQDELPDVYFIAVDVAAGDLTFDYRTYYHPAANVACLTFSEEQAGYLAGYAAVKEGYTKLGFLGGMAVPAVIRYGYGFVQGADAAAKETGAEVEINYTYGGQFFGSPEITAKMAGWYQNGTEVVFACGGGIYTSALEAAEKNGGKVIGMDVDQSYISPLIITSAMKGLQNVTESLLDCLNKGSWATYGGKITNLGLMQGEYVGLPTDTWSLHNFSIEEYNAVKDKIKSGKIVVSNATNAMPKVSIIVHEIV